MEYSQVGSLEGISLGFTIRELKQETVSESYLVILGSKEKFEEYVNTYGTLADAVEKSIGISKEEFEVVDRDGLYFLNFKQSFYEENKEFLEELRMAGEEGQVYPAFLLASGQTYESVSSGLEDTEEEEVVSEDTEEEEVVSEDTEEEEVVSEDTEEEEVVSEDTEEEEVVSEDTEEEVVSEDTEEEVVSEDTEEDDLVDPDLVKTASEEIGDMLVLEVLSDLTFTHENEIFIMKPGQTLKITPERSEEDDLFKVLVIDSSGKEILVISEVTLEQVEFLVGSDEVRVSLEESASFLLEKFFGHRDDKVKSVSESVKAHYGMMFRRGKRPKEMF